MAATRNASIEPGQRPLAAPAATERLLGGRFHVLQLLKRGNGGETFLCRDTVDGGRVIIKSASGEHLSTGAQMRLEHEAAVLRQVRGPWLAPLLDLHREKDLLYLVMPYIPGLTLEQRLEWGPLSVRDTLTAGCCLLAALQEIHDHGVVHRDLKPANIIVDAETPLQGATLIDFGLAWSARLDASSRGVPGAGAASVVGGTVRYVSPEQAGLLDRDADERSDLYSTGVVLFECLAGRPPFLGETVSEVLRQHVSARPPELRSLGLEVPRVLDEVVQRLLRKDPRDRYQSAAAVLADLSLIAAALDRGVSEPVLVVGLRDQRRTLTEPAFVGRDEELAALDSQLERARQGEGGLVLLESVSGGGKTRLLAELAQRSARQGARVLRGQGLDQAAQRPFQVLAGVAAGLIAAARAEETIDPVLQECLGGQRDAACAALPELAEVLGAGTAQRLGPETFGQVRTLQALSALLDALGSADRPALVLLDDCQWADELTLKLLGHWQRRRPLVPLVPKLRLGTNSLPAEEREQEEGVCRVLVVVAFRSEDVAANHGLRELRASLHLKLPPFGAENLRRLLESMAGPLPNEIVEVVGRLSEGSPFMAAAVLQGLVESGALVAGPAGWRVEPLALADVQSSRHAAAFLVRRIERLPPEVLKLLQAGAVLGKEFDLNLAAALAAQGPARAVAALDAARQRQLIWARTDASHCAFLHDKLRQTLLERLQPAARKELHRRAALLIVVSCQLSVVSCQDKTTDNGQRTTDNYALAYHFDAAGESERALPYALAAADQARARHGLEVAEQQYRIARRGASDADTATRLRIAEGLGDVHMLRGRYEEAARELEIALELAGTLRELAQGGSSRRVAADPTRAQIVGKLGELAFKRGDVRTGSEHIERALRLLGRRVPRSPLAFFLLVLWEVLIQSLHTLLPRLFLGRRPLAGADTELIAVRLYSRLAHLYWFHRGTVPALWAHLRGMNRAERYPPTPELAQAYSEHAPGMSLLARFGRGIAYAEKSLAIRKELGDLWGQGQSLHFYGVVLYASARFEECIARCREAVRLLERTGDYWEVNIARYQIAASLYRLGDLRGAVAESQRMYQSGLELGDAQASGISLDVWARATQGRVPAEVIEAELKRPGGDVQRTAQVLVAEGVRLLGAGQPAEAAAVLERARELVRKAGVKNAWVAPVFPWLATALRQAAEALTDVTPGRRRALLRRAWTATRRALRVARSFPNELPHALRESALLSALRGHRRRARRTFDEGLAVAQRQGAAYEYAQTQLARGQVGRELDWSEAAADVAQAQFQIADFRLPIEEKTARTSSPSAIGNRQSASPRETLSLADRFETVLDAGRRIASALSQGAIFRAIREAALNLLRGERCLVLIVNGPQGNEDIATDSGESADFSRTTVLKALARGRALAFVEGVPDTTSESVLLSGVRSALCAPFFVRGRAVGCFYVTHRQVEGLFGEDEERLADYIATLAGAALENAEGFAELRRLNEALELRITEARRAEKQIQEQAALLDKAQDAISVHGLDDRILFWNRSAERLYGWTAGEALGRRGGELLFRGPSQLEAAVEAVAAKGEWAGELRQVTRAGKEIVVESRWSLVRDDAGSPKARLVVSTDVTEKKKLEAQFLRAQRLESLGTLAGGIAHDINNVLTPILMGVGLLKMGLAPDEQEAILNDLEASAQRGADMVKQILSFARGVEGQRVLLSLAPVIADLERMVTRTFPKSIAVTVDVPPGLWPVAGDATQLYQMLMNLCVNARDGMPAGGRLTLTASNLSQGPLSVVLPLPQTTEGQGTSGPYVLLSVADTGTGIPADLLDKIFDPFFTTKEYGKGTGLGLATVLGILKGHGGFVQVSSTVGVGTRVDAYLPAAASHETGKGETGRTRPRRGQQELILVVDDELFIREITRKNLEIHGYRVLTARDGAEAVRFYAQHREEIRAVLTDMMMPGMDGAATIRALREMNPAVSIIAVSGLTASKDADVQAFLPKPFKAESLLRTLGEVLRAEMPVY